MEVFTEQDKTFRKSLSGGQGRSATLSNVRYIKNRSEGQDESGGLEREKLASTDPVKENRGQAVLGEITVEYVVDPRMEM